MKKIKNYLLPPLIVLVSTFSLYSLYTIGYSEKIYPGISVNNIDMAGLTTSEAKEKIVNNFVYPSEITFLHQSQSYKIPLSSINFSYDLDRSVEKAFRFGRSGKVGTDLLDIIKAPFVKHDFSLMYSLDHIKLKENLGVIAEQVTIEPVYPNVQKTDNGVIVVNKGKLGTQINQEEIEKEIQDSFSLNNFGPIVIKTFSIDPSLSDEESKVLYKRAESLSGKSIDIEFENFKMVLEDKDIIPFLEKGSFDTQKISQKIAEISKYIEREPQNPVFIESEEKVKEFKPSKEGVGVKTEDFLSSLIKVLEEFETTEKTVTTLSIPVKTTVPSIKTEDINNLGIKELLGVGTSKFKGSIPGRVHNIDLAASRLNGVLIAPGETFSFNEALGDVSRYTGYKSAYVIKDGKTILGDGGGVCQVSTTFFRAALNSGLPIIERRAHSYRVYYYEQDSKPGLDATVYTPTTDLKVKNDTPGHILIQAFTDTKNMTLRFEFYGTNDGRIATTTKPVILSSIAPPEDLYQDDPTLPSGVVKQIEHKAWGAKVVFDYSVERNGEEIYKKQFVSNYRPWQAVFLRGIAPAQ